MRQRMCSLAVERPKVKIVFDRKVMGEATGQAVAEKVKELLEGKRKLSMVFAAAPSQNDSWTR